jgi:elongation factor 2
LKNDAESMYQNFIKVVDMVNVIVTSYDQPEMGEIMLLPNRGNVAFGSGKDCWAFTLTRFAEIYAEKFKIEEKKMMEKLWGDNYFDAAGKKWKKDETADNGSTLKRAFCQFIMEPIIKLARSVMDGDNAMIDKMLTGINLTLKKEDRALEGKHLLKLVMSKWLNAADIILEMMVIHLPSPKAAQVYRGEYLYEGPKDDPCGTAIRNCDPNGPVMMYVSKMVPTSDKSRFFAFGRVFSGTIATGMKVRIMGANYIPGKKDDLYEKSIQRTVLMMGRTTEYIPDVPCGNTVGLVGVDQYIMKTGTISSHPDAHCIRSMKYSVSPVVRVAVKAKNA